MKLAISNLAWEKAQNDEVAKRLRQNGFTAVEIAPTKVWPVPATVTKAEAKKELEYWKKQELPIVAMQSLLFGKAECILFGEKEARENMKAHLMKMIELAGYLEAKALVFGSPKNRKIGNLTKSQADEIAIPFFQDLGAHAEENGVYFCIEPNAKHYNCDYVINSTEAIELAKKVNSNGFGVHLDVGCMTLENENIEQAIINADKYLKHFHLSHKDLAAVPDFEKATLKYHQFLTQRGYKGWISYETLTLAGLKA
jgi:D-psicose/D-tagatose/L-ribulose 3-epimerase